MPVVDFHIHAYDYPVNAPRSFVEFMDREMAKAYRSYARFVEQYTTGESYLGVLDEAGVDPPHPGRPFGGRRFRPAKGSVPCLTAKCPSCR
jgi:hypothetical protein